MKHARPICTDCQVIAKPNENGDFSCFVCGSRIDDSSLKYHELTESARDFYEKNSAFESWWKISKFRMASPSHTKEIARDAWMESLRVSTRQSRP